MKALTVSQPWATLILASEKRIETRGWRTRHRGPLLIHAGVRFPASARALLTCEPFQSALRRHGFRVGTDLPRGVVLGSVDVLDCVPVDDIADVDARERAFGNFRPGGWAWLLENPQPFACLVPIRGALSLFDVDEALLPSLLAFARPLTADLGRSA